MDKELTDKDKNEERRADGEQKSPDANMAAPAVDYAKAEVGAYGQHTGYKADLSEKAWESSRKSWNESAKGRLAIRVFSRGIMGAAFFTAGGLLTKKWMHPDIDHFPHDLEKRYSVGVPLFEQDNPLKFFAKLIDTVVGKPIELTVNMLGGDGKNAVRFRPTKFKGYQGMRGRSLGNEVVTFTFDFFCASVGDAWGRDIAGWFDPNVKKKWIKNGHIDFPTAVKQAYQQAFRYITYNGGEDWAVAIPYAYYMKAQRRIIDKFSPGFAYDFDRSLNGASFKLNDHHQVVGNYNMEGIADLQGRFVSYNIGTLMFRELWDFCAKRLHGHHAVLYGDPDPDHAHKKSFSQKTADAFKWIARSFIKGGLYMTPAVPFFWITRTPQTKHRGLFIHPEYGMMSYENQTIKQLADAGIVDKRKYEALHANEMSYKKRNMATGLSEDTPVYFSKYDHKTHTFIHPTNPDGTPIWLPGKVANPLARGAFDPHDRTFNFIDRGINKMGEVNYYTAKLTNKPAEWADKNVGKFGKRMLNLNPEPRPLMVNGQPIIQDGKPLVLPGDNFSRFAHPFVNAAFSYTPYMYAKAEFAKLWDDGKMDVAIERTIEGAAKLNWGEFKAGLSEVSNAFLHEPFNDPKREAVAAHRKKFDTSLTDAVNLGDRDYAELAKEQQRKWEELRQKREAKKQTQEEKSAEPSEKLSWRERVVQGEKPEVGANNPKGHTEREEMREALKDLQPPTNSIN